MSLLVEDGSGVDGAESYSSIAEIVAYALDRGLSFADSPLEPAEAAARRATAWLDGTYLPRFNGTRTNGRSQGLQWPRSDATDAGGEDVADDEVPVEIKRAHAEIAIRELAAPGSLSPDYVASAQALRKKVGPIEIEYREAYGADSVRTCVQVVDDILAPLLGRRRQILFGTSGRT